MQIRKSIFPKKMHTLMDGDKTGLDKYVAVVVE